MLAIRLRRQGRTGHAHYRVIVQDSRWHPTNGKVVAYLGTYDPHTKAFQVEADAASTFLSHGAQPSPRVARLLKGAGVKLPKWVTITKEAKSGIRNPEKLRKNRPKTAPAPVAETPEAAATEQVPADAKVPENTESEPTVEADTPIKEELTEEIADVTAEKPAEEPVAEPEAPAQ